MPSDPPKGATAPGPSTRGSAPPQPAGGDARPEAVEGDVGRVRRPRGLGDLVDLLDPGPAEVLHDVAPGARDEENAFAAPGEIAGALAHRRHLGGELPAGPRGG